MRPVNKGEAPGTYTRYGKAKDDLIDRLGPYCSYCEMNVSNQADVEHVSPKSKNPSLELEWENFLLGCKACNIIKSNNNDDRDGIPFPDEWNTAMLFDYRNGLVSIKKGLSDEDRKMAENLFNLVELDRRVDTSNKRDDRFRSRRVAYEKAIDTLSDYKEAPSPAMVRVIGRNIEGFHSVWLEVFKDYPEVKKVILEEVAGTAMECYDSETFDAVEEIVRSKK